MKIIGITGGVGAGKSCVLAALKKMCNCDIVMADDVARQIMEKGGILTAKAYELFGKNAYNEDGTLNKELLSGVIYNNPSVKKQWELAVHPATNAKIKELILEADAKGRDYIFIEAALLIENNYDKICDEIWYVYADETTRRERLLTERGYSEEKIKTIFKDQLKDDEFRKHCSFVINTGGSFEDTAGQLQNKLEEYKQL